MDKTIIGKNIDRIRIERHLTKKQLAEMAGFRDLTTSKHIMNGEMDLDTVIKYAEVLGVKPHELLSDDSESFTVTFDIALLYPQNLAFEALKYRLSSDVNLSDKEVEKEARDKLYLVHIPTFERILASDAFTEREKEVMDMKWNQHMTYDSIAEHIGKTRERARQLTRQIIRKLAMREPYYIMVSPEKYSEVLEKATKYELMLGEFSEKEIERPTIYELELSVRTHNCLTRRGYHYIDELIGVSVNDLANIRNMGNKSLGELLSKLKNFGIGVEEHENGELFTAPIMTKENRFLTKGDN